MQHNDAMATEQFDVVDSTLGAGVDPLSDPAIDTARVAAVAVVGADAVGEFLGSRDEPDVLGNLVSYSFASRQSGYAGWFWSVSVSGAEGQYTVNDVVLLPGADAVVAPGWTPYRERIRPGDLGPGDLLPPEDDDLRLVPAWSAGDSQDTVDRYFAREIGLGRKRVLSAVGRDLAAERWHEGPQGPDSPIAEQAPGTCSTCGFIISLAGPLAQTFGVCANGDANADGRVVDLLHGCGAHSAARLKWSDAAGILPPPVLDTVGIDPLVFELIAELGKGEEPAIEASVTEDLEQSAEADAEVMESGSEDVADAQFDIESDESSDEDGPEPAEA